eukprot:15217923-Heterocapsa_arctica.AAC.1
MSQQCSLWYVCTKLFQYFVGPTWSACKGEVTKAPVGRGSLLGSGLVVVMGVYVVALPHRARPSQVRPLRLLCAGCLPAPCRPINSAG